jgi:hypothetical protein
MVGHAEFAARVALIVVILRRANREGAKWTRRELDRGAANLSLFAGS